MPSVDSYILGHLVQTLEHAGHQVTGHEHLEDRISDGREEVCEGQGED